MPSKEMYPCKKPYSLLFCACLLLSLLLNQSCDKELISVANDAEMLPLLSEYNIFKGDPSKLIPTNDFALYELATQLFSDYAEKQRLIKIPTGHTITPISDGLPDFPLGTIIVKTFFYYNDKRDTTKGRKIIETRLLVKTNSSWSVGTYLWNDEQTDAVLITTGLDKTMNWIDKAGRPKVISYHVPGNPECITCHQSNGAVIPIGPKIRNLNINVTRNGTITNQLQYLNELNLMSNVTPSSFNVLPNWENPSYTLAERTRAYLDVNCAHCHSAGGFASDEKIGLSYDISLSDSRIATKKTSIVSKIESGQMPKLGTTLVDEGALELIKSYMKSL